MVSEKTYTNQLHRELGDYLNRLMALSGVGEKEDIRMLLLCSTIIEKDIYNSFVLTICMADNEKQFLS